MTEPRRRSLSRPEREAIAARDSWICGAHTDFGCHNTVIKNSAWQIDHIVAWELTHDDSPENLQLLCWDCHQAKTQIDRSAINKSSRQRDKHDAHTLALKRGERRLSKRDQRRAKMDANRPPSTRQTTEVDDE